MQHLALLLFERRHTTFWQRQCNAKSHTHRTTENFTKSTRLKRWLSIWWPLFVRDSSRIDYFVSKILYGVRTITRIEVWLENGACLTKMAMNSENVCCFLFLDVGAWCYEWEKMLTIVLRSNDSVCRDSYLPTYFCRSKGHEYEYRH